MQILTSEIMFNLPQYILLNEQMQSVQLFDEVWISVQFMSNQT